MPDEPITTFDGVAGSFSKYDTTLRGHVRYQVVRRNLTPYLGKAPLKVLDVGGGSGPDAAWLVSLGHQVTIVEISKEQRLYAERRFNFFLRPEERALITMVEGELSSLPAPAASFDVVLCHGVAMYQPAPRKFIAEVISWAKPGGLVSLLEKGYYGAEARAIYKQDFEQLESLHASQKIINNLGLRVHAFTPDALETIIEMTGAKIEQWSGVRVITDRLPMRVADMSKPALETVIEAEYSQGNNSGIRAQGQMLHFIIRR
ncbi:MAG: methyltransferase domain-containing protein [Patescibacteria group bacterium]|nr:methyltransferase domain-containing protein [Patescibacteria group bacterium]